jgi:hypothetical protein
MTVVDPQNLANELAGLLHAKLGIRRGDTLLQKLPLARALLPRAVQRAARVVAEAAKLSGHPKLMKRVDLPAVVAAHRLVADHLRRVDPKERRKDVLLGVALSLAVNLLLLALGMLGLSMVLPF